MNRVTGFRGVYGSRLEADGMKSMAAWTTVGVAAFCAASATPSARGADAIERSPAAKIASPAPEAKTVLRHGVFRFHSYPAAWTAAQKTNKPILVYATTSNCPHCVRMIGESYRSPQVSRFVNDSFETVYVDRGEQPELTAKLRVRWFPTTIIVGPNNQVLDVIEGYVDPKMLAQRLQTTFAAHAAATQTR